jgi:hypothetical protein
MKPFGVKFVKAVKGLRKPLGVKNLWGGFPKTPALLAALTAMVIGGSVT